MGPLLTVLTPLVAVPLTMITFYLRSLREHQISWHAELVRRVECLGASVDELRKTLGEFERDYTTKEEWLRECMLARATLERLKEAAVRMEATLQGPPAAVSPSPLRSGDTRERHTAGPGAQRIELGNFPKGCE